MRKFRCWDDSSNEEWPVESELDGGVDVVALSVADAAVKFAQENALELYDAIEVVIRDDLGQYHHAIVVRDWSVASSTKTTLAELRGESERP